MGRGDKKSAKGKRVKGSYGVSRNKGKIKARLKRAASKKTTAAVKETAAKPKKTARKKADA